MNGRIWGGRRRRWRWRSKCGMLRSVQGCVSSGRSRDEAFTPFSWFLAFSGWVPLAGAVPGLVCILKAYGYTGCAGSENKYCLLKPSETGWAVCGEGDVCPDGDGNHQAKSQLRVKDVNTEYRSLELSSVGFTCTPVRWGWCYMSDAEDSSPFPCSPKQTCNFIYSITIVCVWEAISLLISN